MAKDTSFVIKYILAMALCERNAHIIVMTSPLELVNLMNSPYIIAHVRTTSHMLRRYLAL